MNMGKLAWLGRGLQILSVILVTIAIIHRQTIWHGPIIGERRQTAEFYLYAGFFVGIALFALGSYIDSRENQKKMGGGVSEAFRSTLIISVLTMLLLNIVMYIQAGHGNFLVDLLLMVLSLISLFCEEWILIAPAALVIAILILFLKRMSLLSVVLLLGAVILCSSLTVCFFELDKLGGVEEGAGLSGQFDWLFCSANIYGIVAGFVSSLIAFTGALKRRKKIAAMFSTLVPSNLI